MYNALGFDKNQMNGLMLNSKLGQHCYMGINIESILKNFLILNPISKFKSC